MKKLLVLALAGSLAGAAFAYPTLTGPTGTGNMPTAVVVAPGVGSAAIDWVGEDMVGFDDAIAGRVLYGAAANLEVGAMYTLQDTDGLRADRWGVNAKYQLPIDLAGADLALGANFQDFTDADINATNVYLVGTKAFATGEDLAVNGSLGVNWRTIDLGGDSEDAFSPFASVSVGFNNGLVLALDYQLEDDVLDLDPVSSIVARYGFTDALSAQVGFSNQTLGGLGNSDHNLFAGVNFGFGGE